MTTLSEPEVAAESIPKAITLHVARLEITAWGEEGACTAGGSGWRQISSPVRSTRIRVDHMTGGVIRAAYELNHPLAAVKAGRSSGVDPARFLFPFPGRRRGKVMVEALKQAGEADEAFFRLYRAHGGEENAVRLRFGHFEIQMPRSAFDAEGRTP